MHTMLATLAVIAAALPSQTQTLTERQATRETPVVRVCRTVKDSVVNISTTQVIERRSGWFDDDIFNFFNVPGPFVQRIPTHSLGSGFVIHDSGYIVTNAHVIQRGVEISVSFADQTTLKAVKAYTDNERDLAVIKVEPEKPLQAIRLGRGDDLMIGETVIAIGNPLGYHHTVTTGVISAVDRELTFKDSRAYRHLIQTDASINPGNSGGPLLNIHGELIGINTAIRGDAQNIGFAISVERLRQVLPDLFDVENIRRADLGFKTAPLVDGKRIRVDSVNGDSPAEAAGLLPGDILLEFDDAPIDDAVDFYVRLLERPMGQALRLTVERDDQERVALSIPFEAKPKADGAALARKHLGLNLTEVSLEGGRLGFAEGQVVAVESVEPDSPADRIGVQRGDIIEQLDRQYVRNLDEVGQILEKTDPGEDLFLGVIRRMRSGYYRLTAQIQTR
ncbi:MAG: PDZ domain-containing protein [Phycisphaerae bacterium]|nr:PDZ domain-containing protein [Phycisphaerae bacterium]